MNIFQPISMAIKSIINNKMRSALTMLGIVIGVASVITLVAVMQGAQKIMLEQNALWGGVNQIELGYWGQDTKIGQQIFDYAEEELGHLIVGITPTERQSFMTKYKTKTHESNVYFASDSFDEVKNLKLVEGRSITKGDVENRLRVCVIGGVIKETYFGAMSPIGQTIQIKGLNYEVIGVYESRFDNEVWSEDNMISVPSTMQRELAGTKTSSQFIAKGVDADSTTEYVEKIQEYARPLLRNEWDFQAYTNVEWQEQSEETGRQLTLVAGGVGGISLVVAGIGIMNIMLVTVTERTREIGIRMAIGARRRDIILQFLVEAASVSALGGIIGIALGAGGSAVLSAYALRQVVLPELSLIIGSFIFSAAFGMIFGLYPANKASKLQPVDALRTQ